MVPPPTSVQAVRELAGSVWVPSWAGSVRVTRWRYIIYIEWVLYSEPHHLPRQPTGVDRSWTAAPWAQRRPGTSIYTSRAPSYPVHCPGPSSPPAIRRPRAHACQRTAPSSTPAKGPGGRPGAPWDPRTAAPAPPPRRAAAQPLLPDCLPSAAPPICPSFAANWRMPRAYLGPSPKGPRAPPPSLGEARLEGKRSPRPGPDALVPASPQESKPPTTR